MNQAVHLRELQLIWDSEYPDAAPDIDGSLFNDVEDCFNECPLDRISVRVLKARPQLLQRFISKHQARLRRLTFRVCTFQGDEQTVSTFNMLVRKLDLEVLSLLDVCFDNNEGSMCHVVSQAHWDGREAINAGWTSSPGIGNELLMGYWKETEERSQWIREVVSRGGSGYSVDCRLAAMTNPRK